jgi:hypothetical protein
MVMASLQRSLHQWYDDDHQLRHHHRISSCTIMMMHYHVSLSTPISSSSYDHQHHQPSCTHMIINACNNACQPCTSLAHTQRLPSWIITRCDAFLLFLFHPLYQPLSCKCFISYYHHMIATFS